ncbi:hypothetical protein GCM10009535_04200 [Streptomyces thermocarboxydovorans]|uniref:Uncharacterized protein n=1 Tax=Streptomyces thermocarboxydovorans TaxID=59298 RepID=A0ABN1H8Q0_9ACTN
MHEQERFRGRRRDQTRHRDRPPIRRTPLHGPAVRAPSEVTRTARAVGAFSTAPDPVHGAPPAGRTNHPEMSHLRLTTGVTLRAPRPVGADQHALEPV